jgi:class 3 adenylate cyclase
MTPGWVSCLGGGVGAADGHGDVLFTDIVNSVEPWAKAPQAMADALERHDAIVAAAIRDHRGYVFSTGGYAFCAAFSRAIDAVPAAVDGQRLLQSER